MSSVQWEVVTAINSNFFKGNYVNMSSVNKTNKFMLRVTGQINKLQLLHCSSCSLYWSGKARRGKNAFMKDVYKFRSKTTKLSSSVPHIIVGQTGRVCNRRCKCVVAPESWLPKQSPSIIVSIKFADWNGNFWS